MDSGRLSTEGLRFAEGAPKRPVEADPMSSSTSKFQKTITNEDGCIGYSTPFTSTRIPNAASATAPRPFVPLDSDASTQPGHIPSNPFQGQGQMGQSRQMGQHAASMTADQPTTADRPTTTQLRAWNGSTRTSMCASSGLTTSVSAAMRHGYADLAYAVSAGGNTAKPAVAAKPAHPRAVMQPARGRTQLLAKPRSSQTARPLALIMSENNLSRVLQESASLSRCADARRVPADVDAAMPQTGDPAVLGTSGQQAEYGAQLSSGGGTAAYPAMVAVDSATNFGLAGSGSLCASPQGLLNWGGGAMEREMGGSGTWSCSASVAGATEPQLVRSEIMAPSGPCEVPNTGCSVRPATDSCGTWPYDPFQAAAAGSATLCVDHGNNHDAMEWGMSTMEEMPTPTSKSAVGRGTDTVYDCSFFADGAGVSPAPPAQPRVLQAGVHLETDRLMRTDGGSGCSSGCGAATWDGVSPSSSPDPRHVHSPAADDVPPVASCVAEVDDEDSRGALLDLFGDDGTDMDFCGPDFSLCQPQPQRLDDNEPLQPQPQRLDDNEPLQPQPQRLDDNEPLQPECNDEPDEFEPLQPECNDDPSDVDVDVAAFFS